MKFISLIVGSVLAVVANASALPSASAASNTEVRGWNSAALSIDADSLVQDRIRVRSGTQWRTRTISLWSRPTTSDTWNRVSRQKTASSGRATVKIPTSVAGVSEFQVRVKRTQRFAATHSAARSVTVAVTTPTPSPTPIPTPTVTTVYVTGDIGWSGGGQDLTGSQLHAVSDPVVLPGDVTYFNGTSAEYAANFTPFFGSFDQRAWPVPGNHDYGTGWPYYFTYWGARVGTQAAPWYAKQFGDWLFLMLDSNCSVNSGCGTTSEQYAWAKSQLEAFGGTCVAAVWHHPRWSTSQHGDNSSVSDLFALMREHHVELVLSGHDHDYERFFPSNSAGAYDTNGVAQFVVGTGGASLYNFNTTSPLTAAKSNASYGVLKLDLNATGYGWEFMPTSGTFTDSGTSACH